MDVNSFGRFWEKLSHLKIDDLMIILPGLTMRYTKMKQSSTFS